MENPIRKEAKVDPFDSLPDELLTHIVSFLPLKEAARVACLGRRWRHRWLQRRRIDLDESVFTLPVTRHLLEADGRYSLANGIKGTGQSLFISFASNFAERFAEPKVESFRLAFSAPQGHADEVREWVRAVVARGVETLELDFSDPDTDHPNDNYGRFNLPKVVYGLHQSLRTMVLTRCKVLPGMFGALHALRTLTLSKTAMPRDSIDLLAASCPLLEELYLHQLADTDVVTITSASRRLRVLHIIDCEPTELGVRILRAPALQCFKYEGYLVFFEVEQVPTLEEVDLDFPGYDALDGSDIFCRLLVDLAMVKELTVCSYLLQVIAFGGDEWRLPCTIDKLRHLTLKGVTLRGEELSGIALLMRSYPKLQSLTIILTQKIQRPTLWTILVYAGYVRPINVVLEGAAFWERQLTTPIPCLRGHLQYVSIKGFTGQINQLHFIEFILGAAVSLREVNIYICRERSIYGQAVAQRFAIAKSLLYCPRASADVKITIK